MEKRREEMREIIDIYDEGNSEYVAVWRYNNSVEEYLEEFRKGYEEDGIAEEWTCEEKDGWYFYGFEGSEVWGMCKVVTSKEEEEKYIKMSVEELGELVDSVCGAK
jgi:hypothetical protein